jgi:hypothetical protein
MNDGVYVFVFMIAFIFLFYVCAWELREVF